MSDAGAQAGFSDLMPDTIPDDVADELLSKCGRCCCLCRRFRPTLLQVHHVVERSNGGTNDPDNLIAICITCHSDVHTRRPFTRRFTPVELKQHRDAVIAAVADGKLVPPEDQLGPVYLETEAAYDVAPDLPRYSREAQEILFAAAESRNGHILMILTSGGFAIQTDSHSVVDHTKDPREEARYRKAMQVLEDNGTIEQTDYEGQVFRLTHDGYCMADTLQALAQRGAGS